MSNYKKTLFFAILFLVISISGFLFNCAKQVRPSGGPEDKISPEIVKVTPENKATLVPLNQRIEFEFNESMNRKSLEKAIFITPEW